MQRVLKINNSNQWSTNARVGNLKAYTVNKIAPTYMVPVLLVGFGGGN